ncbi:MAG: hypothetical protein L0Z47_00270 [Actinobacteria bacterium]|nr:hypothetical protein [Actinomycetota bacterium]
MADLTQRDLYVFTTVVDTILPAVEGSGPAWTTPGGELGLAARLPSIFDRLPHDKDRGELKLFLGLLNSAAGGLLLYGRPVAFTRLDGEERAEAFPEDVGPLDESGQKGGHRTEDAGGLPLDGHGGPG